MRKYLMILVLSLGALPGEAYECIVPVLVNNAGWENSSSQQVECMIKTRQGYKGLAVLCSPDKTDLSEKYKTFLTYQRLWQESLKAQSFKKTERIEKEWKVAGYESEIENALYEVSLGLKICR